ncbi:hypothetical protein NM688_g9111 [Phlebia brevispora]|uniref:Uncharacterized protein n=1 Tax=Phlebia brevispora TaxID=194682 RepID=A0ACC1RLX3_9APHY|nr:hypothetical protein NM688_g9111 [Phlebia brevispora]
MAREPRSSVWERLFFPTVQATLPEHCSTQDPTATIYGANTVIPAVSYENVMVSRTRKVVPEVVLTPWRELKRQRRIAILSETRPDYLLRPDEETKYAMTGTRAAQPTNDTLYVKPEPMDVDLSGYTSVSVAHDQPRETVKKEEDIKPENENELVPYQVNVAQPCTDEEIKRAIQALSNPDAKIKRDLEFNYE